MMEVWTIFFSSFFLAMAAVGAGAVMISAASPSCCNVYLLHLHHPSPPSHCPVTAPLTSSEVLQQEGEAADIITAPAPSATAAIAKND
jgi:hypothetical protein